MVELIARTLKVLGIKSWLVSSGVLPGKIFELDWWDEVTVSSPRVDSSLDLRFTCTPAQHSSGE